MCSDIYPRLTFRAVSFSSKHNAECVADITVKAGASNILMKRCVRNIGAFHDSKISVQQHVNAISR